MLSAEKAKLKSARDNTRSHIQREITLKIKLSQTRGIAISLKINLNILTTPPDAVSRVLIADFKKS